MDIHLYISLSVILSCLYEKCETCVHVTISTSSRVCYLLLFPDTPLPKFELVYYQLPASQRVSSEVALKKLMDSPVGKTLTFVKAITVSFTIPEEDEELVSSILQCRLRGH